MLCIGNLEDDLGQALRTKHDCMSYERVQFPCGEENILLPEELPERVDVVHRVIDGQSLLELALLCDALQRKWVVLERLIIPYLWYARQDRVTDDGHSHTLQVVARMIDACGAQSIEIVEPHPNDIASFFATPVAVVRTHMLFADHVDAESLVMAPDHGALQKATDLAWLLWADVAHIDKKRSKASDIGAISMEVTADVQWREVVLLDDMIDTGWTIVKASRLLKEKWASKVSIYATHGLFSGPAIQRLSDAVGEGYVDEVVVTNSIEQSHHWRMRVMDCSWLIA